MSNPISVPKTDTPQTVGEVPIAVVTEDEMAAVRSAKTAADIRSSDAADRTTEGQRAINLIWETTQQRVAYFTLGCALIVSSILGVFGEWLGHPDIQLASIVFIYGVANLIVGFYFSRTNHTKTGGVKLGETGR